MPADDPLAVGNGALKTGDWVAARDAFREALDRQESPEALGGLGEALWWLGDTQASVERRERAYAAFRRRPGSIIAVRSARRSVCSRRTPTSSTAGWRWAGA